MQSNQEYMTYEVLTDEQIQEQSQRTILSPGVYDFEVSKAELRTSKAGNPMVMITLKVWDKEGKNHILNDFLVGTPKMSWKIKHFWESVSKPENYNGVLCADDCLGCAGKVTTGIEKDEKGYIKPRVLDYDVSENEGKEDKFHDDDISF